MRVLLQHKKTGLYFREIEDWVRASVEAMDFYNSTAAIDFCEANKLSDVHLVLKFEEQPYAIVMQVQPTETYAPHAARSA